MTRRILITGMSGVGKSTVTREIALRGRLAVDLDAPEWSEWVDAAPDDALTPAEGKDWIWRVERVRGLLSEPALGEIFVSGCAENMSAFYPQIDVIVLLSASVEIVMERLSARPAGRYGGEVADRRKVAELIATVEPLLREVADHEIDAGAPLDAVVDEVLRLADDQERRSRPSALLAGRNRRGAAGRRRGPTTRRA